MNTFCVGSPCSEVVNELGSNIGVREFEIQSLYYIHF